jgi:hypothetical protein
MDQLKKKENELSRDYSLVLVNLIEQLDKRKYQNNNSLPMKRIASSAYSATEPAIQVQTEDNTTLDIFDIELEKEISELITKKWKLHASNCRFIFLVVPTEMKDKAEEFCARELSSYLVIPFSFIEKGFNRNVEFYFP